LEDLKGLAYPYYVGQLLLGAGILTIRRTLTVVTVAKPTIPVRRQVTEDFSRESDCLARDCAVLRCAFDHVERAMVDEATEMLRAERSIVRSEEDEVMPTIVDFLRGREGRLRFHALRGWQEARQLPARWACRSIAQSNPIDRSD